MNRHDLATKVWQDPWYFIAFGFGSGLMPIAPGTWGTAVGIIVYWIIASLSLPYYLLVTVVAFVIGVWISNKVSQELGVHDHSGIVWDEVVGFLLTMTNAPLGWGWITAGFVLFRVFDIWKPQPIRYIDQHVQGGLGVMLDDVLAAIPAWLIMQVLIWGFHR